MHIPYFLAPMAELSHRALRELIEGFGGCDEYFTEMISAAAMLGGGPFERWYIEGGPRPDKLVYQLVGSDIPAIVKAAALLDSHECIGIDLNMGCSAPLIRKTGAGVAWMGSVDKAGDLVKRVRQVVKRRLSVKMRIGFTDDLDYLIRFCRRLEEEGADLLILHPRTAGEKFKRAARWGHIGVVRQELHIPVAGNGDITSADGLIARATSGHCDAVMVGRAAVQMPWIFALGRGNGDLGVQSVPTLPDPHSLLPIGLRFLELLARWQPPEFHISRARRFFGFFCDNLKWGTHLKNQINRENSLSGIEKVWEGHFTAHEH